MQPRAFSNFSATTDAGAKRAAPEVQESRNTVTFFNNSDTDMDFSYGGAKNGDGGNCLTVPAGNGIADEHPPSSAIYVTCAASGKAFTLWIA